MNTLDIKELLPDLKKLVAQLSDDLLQRVNSIAEINAGLKSAFDQIEKGGRTAQVYEVWREDYLDQVAVAWVLSCVFVRFLEDNDLIDECWLAGDGERRKQAEDAHTLYFRVHPHDEDREYFLHVFKEVGKIPAAADLFSEGKTPLWAVAPSADAAKNLLKFWRDVNSGTGKLTRSFQVENGDTRFLGDLYQELSERAKKKFALLQTPVFVEEFILDRTLTPAIGEFGLENVRMVDPTCGSGHFLLGGFARLFDLWSRPEHTTGNAEKDAQRSLDGVWGVDINPFAVAIARFRLIVAAVQVCGIKRLKKAPGWKLHLATGDSLLFGSRWDRFGKKVKEQAWLASDVESWAPDVYACEDKEAIKEVLGQQYHVVVGNPPYPIVRDRILNAAYRERYRTCHQKYSLAVPFSERFFDLCFTNGNEVSGYVGQITANSFMKREFGKKLIQEFFPKIDLTHVIDTSGAYIPGHGTPTVILFGRNRKPSGNAVRAVLGIKGEPCTPDEPAQGKVWQSIVQQIDRADSQDEFTSTSDVPRTTFNTHPWSIGGGGAAELKEQLDESANQTVGDITDSVGISSVTGEDEVFVFPCKRDAERIGVKNSIAFVLGDMIRDHFMPLSAVSLWPYDKRFELRSEEAVSDLIRILWPCKTTVSQRRRFGTPMLLKGAKWYEWQELYDDKLRTPFTIVFAFVATHNHFILDRGGKVFNRSAPIIKLPADATEDDHLALLGLLNSSTACFWMKQTFHNKGSTVDQHGARQRTAAFEDFYEHTATGLLRFPITESKPLILARCLDQLAQEINALRPEVTAAIATPSATKLAEARTNAFSAFGKMIAIQEELDWACYQLYGLLSNDLDYRMKDLPEIELGHRAFEIVMARQIAKGDLKTTWFERHGSTPITQVPTHWPADYRKLVEQRIRVIETNKDIALIERPEYKRRWNTEPWQEQEQRALKSWMLERLESSKYQKGTQASPELTSTAQMADVSSADAEFLQVAALYRGRPDFDVAALIAELVEGDAVPFLPILRYKPTGLRKREIWERTWDLQRQQDAGKYSNEIPVPPKYATADFLKSDFFRLRGKLDVSKERWISYSHCSTDSDPTMVVGWAGWNHLQQATAIVAYYDARKREGWTAERLKPLLAGLDQLLPWIHQWHPEVDSEYGETAGQSFQHLLESDAYELGLTLEEIRKWTPPVKQTKARQKKAKG